MKKRITDADILVKVTETSKCEFIESYYKQESKSRRLFVKLKCACGSVFDVKWSKFNRTDSTPQKQCKECGKALRIAAHLHDNDWYLKEKEARGILIENSEAYINLHTPISHTCPICLDSQWSVSPNNILQGKSTKCKSCSIENFGGSNKLTDAHYQEKKAELGLKITNIEKYIDYSTPIIHVCPCCGEDWLVAPANVLASNKMCTECSYVYRGMNRLKTPKEVRQILSDVELEWLSGEYQGKGSLLEVKCNCGNTFTRRYSDIRSGWNRCSRCSNALSKGEYEIKNWLELNEYSFVHQQKFDDLRGLRNMPLSYDFGIYSDGALVVLIEYDGEHHFRPIYYRYNSEKEAESALESVQQRDKRKSHYADTNGYALIRLNGKDYEDLDAKLGPILEQYVNTEVSENITRHRNA